ncbi:MAG TPA: decaprenyl-phosphate phosphoribosyltransferase [Actinomycetota bacterium]
MTATDTPPETAETPRRPRSTLRALLVTARPKQWAKNVLVGAAPGAAGVATDPDVVATTALAFVAFSLMSSGAYFVNDARDAEADARHPRKRFRPVAAGELSVTSAAATGVALMLASLGVALGAGEASFVALLAGYGLMTLGYSVWLKHVPVVDMVVVAAGFVLRAIGGAFATDLPISDWFLIVTSFGALFVVTGKRHAEHLDLGEDAAGHRESLATTTILYHQHLLSISSAVTIVAYGLWARETQMEQGGAPWLLLSTLPFVMTFLRYVLLVLSGKGGEPEEILLHDREIQILVVAWAALLGIGIYVA